MTDREIEKKRKQFEKMLKDKNIYKIEMEDNKCCIYYKNGAIFKCRGYIVDETIIPIFNKPCLKGLLNAKRIKKYKNPEDIKKNLVAKIKRMAQ